MNCNHTNPAGYIFCGTCGNPLEHTRCHCGFVARADDIFCGRCGASLAETVKKDNPGSVDADHRFDLESLAQQAAQEKQFLETTHKARVTQDDIRKLLATRRKKF